MATFYGEIHLIPIKAPTSGQKVEDNLYFKLSLTLVNFDPQNHAVTVLQL